MRLTAGLDRAQRDDGAQDTHNLAHAIRCRKYNRIVIHLTAMGNHPCAADPIQQQRA